MTWRIGAIQLNKLLQLLSINYDKFSVFLSYERVHWTGAIKNGK